MTPAPPAPERPTAGPLLLARLACLLGALAAGAWPAATPARAEAQPHRSTAVLTVGNGYGAATYVSDDGSGRTHSIHGFYEHGYRHASASLETVDLCFDAFFGLRAGGSQTWCQSLPETSLGYLDGGLVHAVQSYGGLRLDSYYFAPFDRVPDQSTRPGNLLVMLARLSNPGVGPAYGSRLFALLNFHTGAGRPDPGHAHEQIDWQADELAYLERSTDSAHGLAYRAVPAPTHHATSTDDPADNPWSIVAGGGSLSDRDAIGPGNDRVCAFQWDLPDLAPGEEAWAGVVVGYSGGDPDELLAAVADYVSGRVPVQLIVQERAGWRAWLDGLARPSGLSADETAVFEQQAAVLRMAQCREANAGSFRPHGQLPACLPPGVWNMTWVRDASYAIQALVRLGEFEMARAGLEFLLLPEPGGYRRFDYNGTDYGLGVDYAVSVCRAYGSGAEESDGGTDPNIELDNFGLFLGALGDYVLASGDTEFLLQRLDDVQRRTAYVLERSLGAGGLLRPDSSCWERHLQEALRYGYSNVTAVWGLARLAAALAEAGRPRDAGRDAGVAGALAGAVLAGLRAPSGALIGAAGYPDYCDAALGEAIGLGLLHPDGKTARATLDAFTGRLWQPVTGRGYQRLAGRPFGGEDWYDVQEWVFIDLRLAGALRQAGRAAEADALVGWVTAQARANFDLIPELYTREAADYAGASPMVGFGAGAYILALFGRQPGPLAEVRGRITRQTPEGPPAGGAEIVLYHDGRAMAATVSEAGGHYRLAGLLPGTVEILARGGSGTVRAGLALAPGQIAEQPLVLPDADPPGHGAAPPGGPGAATNWTSGRKLGFGTARGEPRVWFTAGDGRLAEVVAGRIDWPEIKEVRWLVTDGETFFHDATRDCRHTLETLDLDAPAYRVTETDPAGRYRLVWEPLPDPEHDVLYLRVRLDALQGDPDEYQVYAYLDPHLALAGAGDTIGYAALDGAGLLLAGDRDRQAAFGLEPGWSEFSCGYSGSVSDPLADLAAGPPHALDELYFQAGPGEVAAIVALPAPTTGVELFLAFGRGPAGALAEAAAARARLADPGFDGLRAEFVAEWQAYAAGTLDLAPWSGDGGAVFRAARTALACAEDKDYPGAIVASPSFAWGEDQTEGGPTYQKVWGRDAYRAAAGFLAAGDAAAALRCLAYLDEVQQEADGSLPQHSHVDGYLDPGQNEQYDETAAPILLAWRLWRQAGALSDAEAAALYPPLVQPAADFLLAAAPPAGQDRWEEEWGWSPAAMAAQTAALIAAADLAENAGDESSAAGYRARADQLESQIETRTFTSTGGLGDGRYYVRIDQSGNPDDATLIEINSGGGSHREKDIVSADFLELVRLGLRRAADEHVLASLPEVDSELQVDLAAGPLFHRYNHDGYGEKDDGSSYLAEPAFTGRGRLWPVLAGERGQHAIAAGEDPAPLVAAMEAAATAGGLLPEQVWDAADIPEHGLYLGRATGAACPLSWSAGEYLALLRSRREGRIHGRIDAAYARYANLAPEILAAAADPARVDDSGWSQTLLTIEARDPDGRVVAAVIDGSEIGAGELALADDGSGGDPSAGDGIWSLAWTVPAGTPRGSFELPCRVEDELGAGDEGEIALAVVAANRVPRIAAAGLGPTRLSAAGGGTLTLWALALDPDGPPDIASIELLFAGTGTGVFLWDDGAHGDAGAGDGFFSLALPVAGPIDMLANVPFELEVRDQSGAAARWPALAVP